MSGARETPSNQLTIAYRECCTNHEDDDKKKALNDHIYLQSRVSEERIDFNFTIINFEDNFYYTRFIFLSYWSFVKVDFIESALTFK